MKDVLTCRGLVGSVRFSSEDSVLLGKIEGIDDLVSFEGESVAELKRSFREAVEDYVQLCKESGKAVYRSCRGSFNVRLSPELHRKAIMVSQERGISLNQLVQSAVETEVKQANH